jgi:prepilin-type N-terminal cleavage/methylation domain-containing protein
MVLTPKGVLCIGYLIVMEVAMNRKKGFTLIELLVVIIIIGILASFLVPAVISMIRNANVAKCKSNLGQMFQQAFNYKSEFGGKNYSWPPGTADTFTMAIYNALASVGREKDLSDVWTCPLKGGTTLTYDGPTEEVTDASKNNLIIFSDKAANHNPDNTEGCVVVKGKAVYECKGTTWTQAKTTGYYQ